MQNLMRHRRPVNKNFRMFGDAPASSSVEETEDLMHSLSRTKSLNKVTFAKPKLSNKIIVDKLEIDRNRVIQQNVGKPF